MYGKLFASTYTGSMVGSGAVVFAVWGYAISHAVSGHVELNPKLLQGVIGDPEDKIIEALELLCAPDPNSRTPDEEGRRLLKHGPFQYFVVNHEKYRDLRNAEERREYNRQKMAAYRAGKKGKAIGQ